MSPTTTLVTFRVRAPRSTRTLKLYGSWDNFTIAYPMNKDLQTGSEYWHGCFNFSNIICDGNPAEVMRSRSGGLKMGGTYWYYYKIDDETDFHNVCERATSNCPLLPGQLVNVLHVPFALSGNRSRNPSTSSTSSERRTMNPDDKFMNPRPAPSKPDAVRVSTSPVINDSCQESDDQCTPLKDSLNPQKFFRLVKKGSIDSSSTSSSGAALSGGLRAAFRLRTARSRSPESAGLDGGSQRRTASSERDGGRGDQSKSNDPFLRPQHGLLLRAVSADNVPMLSFEQHRQQRSESQSRSASQSAQSRGQPRQVEDLAIITSNHRPVGNLTGTTQRQKDSSDDTEKEPAKVELDLEKRLPTLPNTPSSAYPASVDEGSPSRDIELPLANLESHFSATTIDTEPNLLSVALNERSHFSAWTTTTDSSSVFIDTSVPMPEMRDLRDSIAGSPRTETGSPKGDFLQSILTFSSISSSISTTPSTSFLDVDAEFEAAQLAMGHPSQVPQYSLPESDYSLQTGFKALSQQPFRGRSRNPSIVGLTQQTEPSPRGDEIVHSESMQRLLDELSYLSEMIQH